MFDQLNQSTHQLHKFYSFEEADVLKSPAIDTLQPSHRVCQPFQEYTKGEIYGHVNQNKILSICRGFQHFCLFVNATFGSNQLIIYNALAIDLEDYFVVSIFVDVVRKGDKIRSYYQMKGGNDAY
jgi:hypothetical protein